VNAQSAPIFRRFGLPPAYTFAELMHRYPTAVSIRWSSMGKPRRDWRPEFARRYGVERFELEILE